ncbi:hypothetical protein [Psychromarinibacter sp. S121]|uniref:hypothetical protein n=1 Tax=Psychromarinibacter sp. S121 TaxID=3415127 RepID=UPI003C7A3249
MRPMIESFLLCARMALAVLIVALPAPLGAETALPDSMPPPLAASEIPRNLSIALDDWRKKPGFGQPSSPDRHVLGDFAPILLNDGTAVIPGLGVRLRPGKLAGRDVLEIVDIREFGAVWSARDDPPFGFGGVGGHFGGTLFSLDQALRRTLSGDTAKRLREGFSFPTSTAVPYTHEGEPRVQIQPRNLRVDPLVRPMGRWLVAEPAAETAPDPAAEYDAIVADFRAMLEAKPCSVTGADMMRMERQVELLEKLAGHGLPNVNFRNEQKAACAIAQNGAYGLADLERLAVLRQAECTDLTGGLSESLRDAARDLQRQVAPPSGYLRFAEIGLFGINDPSRRNLSPAEGNARRDCILDWLEEGLFAG